jgi:ERCC4-type nuclease
MKMKKEKLRSAIVAIKTYQLINFIATQEPRVDTNIFAKIAQRKKD